MVVDTASNFFDRFCIVQVLCFFIGLSHYIPLTFFVTATHYWMYKFRNASSGQQYPTNCDERTCLQTNFASVATIATTIPLVVFMILTTAYGDLIRCSKRITITLITMIGLFVVSTIFIKVNTDTWQSEFFALTMLIFLVVNVANAIFGVTTMGVISKFPNNFLNIYLTGQGIAGIFNALLQIISLSAGTSVENSAVIYFMSGCSVLIFTLFLYLLASNFSAYYNLVYPKQCKGCKKNIVTLVEMKNCAKIIWTSVAIFAFTSMTTAMTTPSITNLVVSQNGHSTVWGDKYFVPVCSYLLSNCSDLVGRTASSTFHLKIDGRILVALSFIRMLIFIPLILLCNARPRHLLPVWFPYDYQYIIIIVSFGLTRGFLFSAAYNNASRLVSAETVDVSLSVLTTFVGITSGISSPLSYLSVLLI